MYGNACDQASMHALYYYLTNKRLRLSRNIMTIVMDSAVNITYIRTPLEQSVISTYHTHINTDVLLE